MEDQSGHVVNTYSNLQQVRTMPENGLICIQNAYESTQRLLTNIEVMYAKLNGIMQHFWKTQGRRNY